MVRPYKGYNDEGSLIWQREIDSYGKPKMQKGEFGFCNYLYQGQTHDAETGLCYNRFRYYSPEDGNYISQDPIGLAGGSALYGYVKDTNSQIDIWGLASKVPVQTPTSEDVKPLGSVPSGEDLQLRANELQGVLPEASQGYKTTAVGYATDANGNGYLIAASSDTHLSPNQRNALDPTSGELRASGSGLHAETTVLAYAKENGLTLHSVAASRPVCGGCQAALDEAGVEIVSERKKVGCKKK